MSEQEVFAHEHFSLITVRINEMKEQICTFLFLRHIFPWYIKDSRREPGKASEAEA